MKKITKEELYEILEEHKKWLLGNGGMRADLRGADLRGEDLSYTNLIGAGLRYTD